MSRKILMIILLLVLNLLFLRCTYTINTSNEYLNYINNKDNGLFKEVSDQGYKYAIKYLPAEYLAIQEIESNNSLRYSADSLINSYSNNLTFLFTISMLDHNPQKGLFQNLSNQLYLNLYECFTLSTLKQDNVKLSLGTIENTGGLNKDVTFFLVFPNIIKSKISTSESNLSLVFINEDFNSSPIVFRLKNEDIHNVPSIN